MTKEAILQLTNRREHIAHQTIKFSISPKKNRHSQMYMGPREQKWKRVQMVIPRIAHRHGTVRCFK